jgi:EmrB/QacA subfamily drug resistance transporter
MVVLDVTVVNVALPSIGRSLAFAPDDLSWVVTAYVLCSGGLLLLGGRAADVLGRRAVFFAGLLLFTAASLASGLAPSPGMLITSRALQGIGAAMLTPAALSIIVVTYTGDQHTTALSAWAAIASGGAAAGMLLGGMLTTWLSWEWIFLINVPIGLAVAALAVRMVPASSPASPNVRSLDPAGALFLVGGLGALVYGLQGTAAHGWGSARTLALFAASIALLAGFALIERLVARPLVSPSTWRSRSLVAGAGVMLGATALLVGVFFVGSLYLQTVLHATALETGLQFLPIAGAIGLAAHGAGHALARLGTRAVAVVGLLAVAAAAALLGSVPEHATYAANVLPGFVLLGLGVGLTLPAASVSAMSEVDHETAGMASGLLMTGHEIGAAVGVALLSTVAAGATAVPAGLGTGFADACEVAAFVAVGVAVAAALALPPVRPAAGTRVGLH